MVPHHMEVRCSERLKALKVLHIAAQPVVSNNSSQPVAALSAVSEPRTPDSESRDPNFLPPVFDDFFPEEFAATFQPDDLPPEELNWALPTPLIIMPPDFMQIALSQTLVVNSRACRRIVTYDPEDRSLVAYP